MADNLPATRRFAAVLTLSLFNRGVKIYPVTGLGGVTSSQEPVTLCIFSFVPLTTVVTIDALLCGASRKFRVEAVTVPYSTAPATR